jgi:hypothetical protein
MREIVMPDSLGTTQMRLWVSRIQAGEFAARDELLRAICGRMERLASKMLRGYPTIERFDTSKMMYTQRVGSGLFEN